MYRFALTYLLAFLVGLQTATSLVAMHPLDHAVGPHYAADYASDLPTCSAAEPSGAQDPAEPAAPDTLFHCHHHGCQGHLYLAAVAITPEATPTGQPAGDYRSNTPDAPASSLFRPPIA